MFVHKKNYVLNMFASFLLISSLTLSMLGSLFQSSEWEVVFVFFNYIVFSAIGIGHSDLSSFIPFVGLRIVFFLLFLLDVLCLLFLPCHFLLHVLMLML